MLTNAATTGVLQTAECIEDIYELYKALEETAKAHEDTLVINRFNMADDYREQLLSKFNVLKKKISHQSVTNADIVPLVEEMITYMGRLGAEYRSVMDFARDNGKEAVSMHADVVIQRTDVIADEVESRLKQRQREEAHELAARALVTKRRQKKSVIDSVMDFLF